MVGPVVLRKSASSWIPSQVLCTSARNLGVLHLAAHEPAETGPEALEPGPWSLPWSPWRDTATKAVGSVTAGPPSSPSLTHQTLVPPN